MIWARIRESIGKIWGATTTLLLAAGAAIDPILQGIDPAILQSAPWLKWVVFGLAIAMALLRVFAPPPPALPIHIDDQVEVDHAAGTVTVTKATAMPANVVTKAAGEKV